MESTNWSIPCIADDEDLEPSAEELEAMYQKLESGSLLDLQWKCPGRRTVPTPPSAVEAEVPVTPEKEMFVLNVDSFESVQKFIFLLEISFPE